MKVLVVGSCRQLPPEQQERFRNACMDLGRALARGKHTVIVCSASDWTADPNVGRGMNSVPGNHRIVLLRPDTETAAADPESNASLDSYRALSNVTVNEAEVGGGWRVVHLKAIREANLIIAISGTARGTGTVIYSAEAMEKSVALASGFPGAARDAWRDLKRHYSDKERSVFQREWAPNSSWAEDLIQTATAFARRKPMATFRARTSIVSLLIVISAIAGWITVMVNLANRLHPILAGITVLVVLAAYLGILLRASLVSTSYPWRDRIHHLFQAVLIAFAVLLLSEMANLFLSNKPILLGRVADKGLIGLRLSLAGFLAGFGLDEYVEALEKRTRKLLS